MICCVGGGAVGNGGTAPDGGAPAMAIMPRGNIGGIPGGGINCIGIVDIVDSTCAPCRDVDYLVLLPQICLLSLN